MLKWGFQKNFLCELKKFHFTIFHKVVLISIRNEHISECSNPLLPCRQLLLLFIHQKQKKKNCGKTKMFIAPLTKPYFCHRCLSTSSFWDIKWRQYKHILGMLVNCAHLKTWEIHIVWTVLGGGGPPNHVKPGQIKANYNDLMKKKVFVLALQAKEIPGIKIIRSSATINFTNSDLYLEFLQEKVCVAISVWSNLSLSSCQHTLWLSLFLILVLLSLS